MARSQYTLCQPWKRQTQILNIARILRAKQTMGLFGIFQNYAAYGRLTLVHMGPIHVGLEYRIRSCKVTATGNKHRKNCECCPRHSLFMGHNVNVNIVVLNSQKCNQCLKCQVSGHKSLESLFEDVL